MHRPASFLESRLEFQQAVAPAMAELEGEKMVLESINEAATMLLTYEKEDAGAQDNYFPGKFQGTHALEVDVGMPWARLDPPPFPDCLTKWSQT